MRVLQGISLLVLIVIGITLVRHSEVMLYRDLGSIFLIVWGGLFPWWLRKVFPRS